MPKYLIKIPNQNPSISTTKKQPTNLGLQLFL